MAENKLNKKVETARLATSAQWKLCYQLYEETNYSRKYDEKSFMELNREQASRHIAAVKEFKVASQGLIALNQQGIRFDKIGFAMLYKLFITEEDRQYFAHRCRGQTARRRRRSTMTAFSVFKTKTSWLHEIGVEVGLKKPMLTQYVCFMQDRFPNERFKSYAAEWASRWLSERPEDFADSKSLVAIAAAKLEVGQ